MTSKIQRITARYRYSVILLRELVRTDFKLRYQGSVLGYFWSLLRPLALFVILYLVFVKILGSLDGVPHPGVFLFIGIVLWNYFAEVTNTAVAAVVEKGDLMRKVSFPRYVIIVAGSFSALINLFFNFIVIAIFMVVVGTDINRTAVLMPLLIVELFIFALSVGFLLSALYVRYRDVKFIWEVAMQGAFFATPIMYAFVLVSDKSMVAAKILMASPMTQIMQDARYMLVTPTTQTVATVYGSKLAYVIPLAVVATLAIATGVYFRIRAPYFAEEV